MIMWRKYRRLNRIWASLAGYYWLRCPSCGTWFGGHETSGYDYYYSDIIASQMCWKHTKTEYAPGLEECLVRSEDGKSGYWDGKKLKEWYKKKWPFKYNFFIDIDQIDGKITQED